MRLPLVAPIAAPTAPGDHLDPLIRVGIMPGLMHGISASRPKSARKSRSLAA